MASATNPYSVANNTLATGAQAITAANGGSSGNTASATSAQSLQNNFLTLLTAQLNAQDPLNPMDNSQLTTQMAQISQVSGLQTLNQTMQQLVSSQNASQSMMAAGMIGGQVLVAGNTLNTPAAGQTVQAGVMLNGPASAYQVNIVNKNGTVVDTMSVSNPSAGMNTFKWDGTDGKGNALPAGQYTFQVQVAQASSGGTTTATAYNNQQVQAVTWSSGTPMLVLSGNQTVPLSAVAQMS
ncbi:flagellar hook assembly protein FlgD [Chromobacterium sp. IIBBL 290-4]|uniref:flagellar hook assembly protein FlgD n=1 Tax=Chromobacterium sp. IIBBL 290-4 TaxID=2953890 RepID=UPI0020B6A4B8|nr:flagellar hook capping FlgD N-terminal domain-containing protein [Chromobacterium sp. IIBBL 290-4]UTH73845.1 flagellar hook capping protein [Chromobacterium sp. IIBBL 290-4]